MPRRGGMNVHHRPLSSVDQRTAVTLAREASSSETSGGAGCGRFFHTPTATRVHRVFTCRAIIMYLDYLSGGRVAYRYCLVLKSISEQESY